MGSNDAIDQQDRAKDTGRYLIKNRRDCVVYWLSGEK
jgi:hypothetical protein